MNIGLRDLSLDLIFRFLSDIIPLKLLDLL